jgi:hypothetical protein
MGGEEVDKFSKGSFFKHLLFFLCEVAAVLQIFLLSCGGRAGEMQLIDQLVGEIALNRLWSEASTSHYFRIITDYNSMRGPNSLSRLSVIIIYVIPHKYDHTYHHSFFAWQTWSLFFKIEVLINDWNLWFNLFTSSFKQFDLLFWFLLNNFNSWNLLRFKIYKLLVILF